MAIYSEDVVGWSEVFDFPFAAGNGGDERDDWDFNFIFREKFFQVFSVAFVLEKWVIEVDFFVANVLNPVLAFGVAVNVATVIFAFKDKETFFRNYEQVDF